MHLSATILLFTVAASAAAQQYGPPIPREGAVVPQAACPRGYFCLRLPISAQPATLSECAAARPELGHPEATSSLQDRVNEPFHSRTCYWRRLPTPRKVTVNAGGPSCCH